MAAPVETYVQLPDDSGNTGKKLRTQSRVVGANTVHTHYVVPISIRKLVGLYYFVHAVQSLNSAAADNGTTTGTFWLAVPAGATVNARLRRLEVVYSMTGEADMLTVPRITLARFTFTGTPSGATVTACKRATSDNGNTAIMYSASSGWTPVLGALAWTSLTPTLGLTTSGQFWAGGPVHQYAPLNEDEFIDIAPGEGVVLYEPDAATSSDTRRYSVCGSWDEYDNA